MPMDEPHRRRKRPPLIDQDGAPDEPLRIVVTHDEDTPDWMVSARDVSGAASRRTKAEHRESPAAQAHSAGNHRKDERGTANAPRQPRTGAAQKESAPRAGGEQEGSAKPRKPAASKPRKKKPMTAKEKRRIAQTRKRFALLSLTGVLAVVLLMLGLSGGMRLMEIKRTLDQGDGVFYPNIFVNGIPLEGKTLDEAATAVAAQVTSQLASWSITLTTGDGRSWVITGDDLKMQYDVADQLDGLWSIGHTGSSQERYAQVKALEENPQYVYTTLTYDMSAVNQIVTQIKNEVDRAPVNATRVAVSDETTWPPYTYTDDVPGVELDVSGLNEQIMGMVNRLESGTVQLTPTAVEADVTREYLEGQIVKLATFETSIGKTGDYVESRHENIRIGTEQFDRLIIKSGETVSFNKVTGKRTAENGYWPALEIAYGEYREGYGGGICQVSSTLYNAVVNAGLQIVTRTAHAIPSSYVDMGLDATVSDDRYDFVFRNSTDAEIFISAEYYHGRDNYWRTKFTIYGRPDPNGYTYKLESKVVEEIPLPDPEYRQDKDGTYVIYNDEEYQSSSGRKGYVVEAWLVTYDSKGLEVSRELDHTDTYKASAPVVYVGVTPRETPVPEGYYAVD